MFDEATVRGIVEAAERAGAPASVSAKLEADLKEVMYAHRRRMDRINRHSEVMAALADCNFQVTATAAEMGMTRQGIYKHIHAERLSTDLPSGVDSEAA